MQMMQINTEFNEWRVCADVSVSGVTESYGHQHQIRENGISTQYSEYLVTICAVLTID